MKRLSLSITLICLFTLCSMVGSAAVPKPERVLGFKIGSDRKMADMKQIVAYFRLLDRSSPRVSVTDVGKTTEGNPFIAAIITSENNHKNLDRYQRYQQLLADPRKISQKEAENIIVRGKTVVMINCSLHATEIGASQMSMRLAYDLARLNDSQTRKILDNVILVLIPMHNPDGIQMVADWYRKNLNTSYEGGPMPWLYHKYVGHDNNRDWYMFTQVETQLTLKVHNAWHPQIVLDMHQMGSNGARLFVPPYVDPFEPNVDPILRQQVAMMGTYIASTLTGEGKGGVIHSSRFDAWTPARAYHHYHGGIRILTEAASVRIATPITVNFSDLSADVRTPSVKMPLPWRGGKWRIGDIIDYDYSAARAALTNAAGLRTSWLRNFFNLHKKAVEYKQSPRAYILPVPQEDLPATVNLLNVLKMGGVEIHRSRAAFSADGHEYPAGSYIVYLAQPYGGFAKTLLERQEYPEIRSSPDGPLKTPYDVVAHTLPLLMGVEAVAVNRPFKAAVNLIDRIKKPSGRLLYSGNPALFAWGHRTNDDIIALNRLLKHGARIYWTASAFSEGDIRFGIGTMVVENSPGLIPFLEGICNDLLVTFSGLEEKPGVDMWHIPRVRLGLYKSYSASMDEGWTRWVLEQYEFPFKSIYDKDIRRGNLGNDFDVIIFPDLRTRAIISGRSERSTPPQYAGGIGQVGVTSMRRFIEKGGTLITLNSAADFPIKQFYLSIENRVESLDRKSFFIPGSILKVLNNQSHPITYGFKRDAEIFFRRSPVFSVREGKSVVRYPLHNPLLSGWLNGEKYLANQSAIADVPFGSGKIILIGFPAQYRAQSQGTFRYLFNAIFYGPATRIGGK